MSPINKVYEEIYEIFNAGGAHEYLGEDVKLVEHMLQCADLAREAGAADYLVVAALLHDIGHLLVEDPQSAQDSKIDMHHEAVGARWVEARFPGSVSEPIRLHVAAKRYLVTTNRDYVAKLSPASVQTLNMQGGPFSQEELIEFTSSIGAEDAVRIRLWDDLAKVRDKQTSTIFDFEAVINALAI